MIETAILNSPMGLYHAWKSNKAVESGDAVGSFEGREIRKACMPIGENPSVCGKQLERKPWSGKGLRMQETKLSGKAVRAGYAFGLGYSGHMKGGSLWSVGSTASGTPSAIPESELALTRRSTGSLTLPVNSVLGT